MTTDIAGLVAELREDADYLLMEGRGWKPFCERLHRAADALEQLQTPTEKQLDAAEFVMVGGNHIGKEERRALIARGYIAMIKAALEGKETNDE